MPVPQFLHPLTPGTKRPKLSWILGLIIFCAAFAYLAMSGKNGNGSLFHQKPPPKPEPAAYNPNNQLLIEQAFLQGQDPNDIATKNAALQAVKSQEGSANPEANRETEQQVTQALNPTPTPSSEKVTELDERLRKFNQTPHTKEEIQQFQNENQGQLAADTQWKTISEQIATKQLSPRSTVTMNGIALPSTPAPTPSPPPVPLSPQDAAKEETRQAVNWDKADEIPNFLPLHTVPIPCVLLDNIKTGQLQQNLRAIVCQDVVFAGRIQIRAYTCIIIGKAATEPVGDTVDIHFDTIVWADGSELPISGSAYSPEDPRYPGEGSHRGIHGILTTPPIYTKILAWLGNAGQATLQQYLQDSQNIQPSYGYGAANNSQFPTGAQTGTTTTTTTTDPPTGKQTVVVNQDFSAPNNLNPNWRQRAAVAAASSGASQLNQELQSYLIKYQPYVTVDRGYPLWVDLDQTINLNARRLNGVLHAQLTETEAEGHSTSLPQPNYYPPGDARNNAPKQVNNPQVSSGIASGTNLTQPVANSYNTPTPYGVNSASNANNAAIQAQLLALQAQQQQRYLQTGQQPTPTPPAVILPPNPNLNNTSQPQ